MVDIQSRIAMDPEGFIGFLQTHQHCFDPPAAGIIRKLLAESSSASAKAALALLTKRQAYALCVAVEESGLYTPICDNCKEFQHPWGDMPVDDCGLCVATGESINKM